MIFLCSGMSIRAMARVFNCSAETVNRKIAVLSRQASVYLDSIFDSIHLNEDLVADGFESFAVSQYFPNNFNILVGKDSQFVYYFNYVQLHRKGRMTQFQQEKAIKLKKIWPLSKNNQYLAFLEIKQKVIELLMESTNLPRVTIYTDEKKEYKTCLKDIGYLKRYDDNSTHVYHKRINSKKHRDLRNELFSVNYFDRELRKDLAEHHRESVCFARNVNCSTARFSVYLLYHNFFKSYRINNNSSKTHADAAGLNQNDYIKELRHFDPSPINCTTI